MSFLKLLIVFVLLYIVFSQAKQIYMGIYRYFVDQRKQRKPDIRITRIPPKSSKKYDKEGEYVDYEEVKDSTNSK